MEEINEMILDAIKRDEKPPKAFVLAVLSGEIQLADNVMNALSDKGWINRQKCEVWTRVMGYFRPVSQFNAGKKSEYAERVLPRVEDIKAVTES
jgi:hypothetical protein